MAALRGVLLALLLLAAAATAGDSSQSSESSESSSGEGHGAEWVRRAAAVCPFPPRLFVTLDEVRGTWWMIEGAGPAAAAAQRDQCQTVELAEDGGGGGGGGGGARMTFVVRSFTNGSVVAQRSTVMTLRTDDNIWVDTEEGWGMWMGRSANARLLLICAVQGVTRRPPALAFSLALAAVPRVDERDLAAARGPAFAPLASFVRPPLSQCRPPAPSAAAQPAREDEPDPDIQLLH